MRRVLTHAASFGAGGVVASVFGGAGPKKPNKSSIDPAAEAPKAIPQPSAATQLGVGIGTGIGAVLVKSPEALKLVISSPEAREFTHDAIKTVLDHPNGSELVKTAVNEAMNHPKAPEFIKQAADELVNNPVLLKTAKDALKEGAKEGLSPRCTIM